MVYHTLAARAPARLRYLRAHMHRICTGTNEDPCKMTCSKIAFLERSLPDKRANSNQHEMQGKHGRIWHEGTERTGKALGMGRCSSPLR